METIIWVYTQDGCDGSARPMFFRTEEDAEAYAEKDFEAVGQRLCEDICKVTLRFDADGKLLNPAKLKDFV